MKEYSKGTYKEMPRHVRILIRIIVWQLNLLALFLGPMGYSPEFVIYQSAEPDEDEYEIEEEKDIEKVH